MRPQVAIVYSLARSGGTIFSRCLACIPGNVMLSEIHPRWSYYDPLTQARDWFGLISEREHQEFLSRYGYDYPKAIQLLSSRCIERGLHLIIRDWTHVDFFAGPFPAKPIYRLSQYEVLKNHFDVRHIALIRHPVDTCLSLRKLPPYKNITAHDFLSRYRLFANFAQQLGFVRYEDFCDNPARVIASVCNTLGVNYSEEFLAKYKSYTTITGELYVGDPQGDNLVQVYYTTVADDSFNKSGKNAQTGDEKGSRSTDEIRRPPRRTEQTALTAELQEHPLYAKLIKDLGYDSPSE
jgi:hypothetical protein